MFEPSIPPPLPPMANPVSEQPPWVPIGTKDCSQGFCSIYCPHWCYIVFPPPPPPPPFAFTDNEDDPSGSPTFSPLAITVIGILASAFLLISYYTVVSRLCGGSSFHIHRQRRRRDNEGAHVPPTAVGLDKASIDKITVCKYRRGGGPVGCSDCPVCLSEFLEDESLRLLPECGHAFHVRCIDTWLKSHSNCPLCRADILLVNAAPPPPPPPPPPPETNQPEGLLNDEMGESGDGTSLENESGSSLKEFDVIEIGEVESRGMRRSLSMDSFRRNRVSVADILQVDMEDDRSEAADAAISVVGNSLQRSRGEHSKGSSCSLRCDSPIAADEEIGV